RHSRALIKLDNDEAQVELLMESLEKDLNVRQTEDWSEQKNEPKDKKKRTSLKGMKRDIRIAMNTIRQSLSRVSETGIHVETDEEEYEDYYQFTIKIPKKND